MRGKLRTDDPTLPRNGIDDLMLILEAVGGRLRTDDPTLRRSGTNLMPLCCVFINHCGSRHHSGVMTTPSRGRVLRCNVLEELRRASMD